MLKKGIIAFCITFLASNYLFSSFQVSPKPLENFKIMDSSNSERATLLNEYLATSSFIVRQIMNHKLKPNDYKGIVSSLKDELSTTVQGLKNEFEKIEDGPSKEKLIEYVEGVNSAVEKIPMFLGILSKHPRGDPELDERAAKILKQLTTLRSGLIDLAKELPNSSL